MSLAQIPSCQLYLITPSAFDLGEFADAFRAALDGGPVACVQLRLKDCPDDDIRRATEALMPLAHARDTAFLINDRPDLARDMGCDGVHVGQTDTPYAEARRVVGDDGIVGVTCHNSRHLAMVAAESGADYVAFGAFFPTSTKDVEHHADPSLLSWWSDIFEVPSVAIGGITVDNCAILIEAGADFLAVSGGVWNYPAGPAASVQEFSRLLSQTLRFDSE